MYSKVAANRETNSTTCTMLNVYFWEVWCTQYVQLQLIERPLLPLVQCPITEKNTVQSSCGLIERPLLTLLVWCIYTVQLRLIERPPSWPSGFGLPRPNTPPLVHYSIINFSNKQDMLLTRGILLVLLSLIYYTKPLDCAKHTKHESS